VQLHLCERRKVGVARDFPSTVQRVAARWKDTLIMILVYRPSFIVLSDDVACPSRVCTDLVATVAEMVNFVCHSCFVVHRSILRNPIVEHGPDEREVLPIAPKRANSWELRVSIPANLSTFSTRFAQSNAGVPLPETFLVPVA
jgi:hypothetical protein